MRTNSHPKKSSLSIKMAISILAGTGLIFLVAFGYNYYYSRNLVLESARENARHLTHSVGNKIETVIQGVEKLPEALAFQLQNRDYTKERLSSLIKGMVQNNPELHGLSVSFEPYVYNRHSKYFSIYYYRKNGKLQYNFIGSQETAGNYNYFRWDWYLIPRELKRSVWIDPFYGEQGETIMTTYSVPLFQEQSGKKKVQGIVEVDIALDWLQNLVSEISVYENGYAFLISNNGKFVSHPDDSFIMRKSIFSVAEAQDRPELRRIGRKMLQGKQGFSELGDLHTEDKHLLFYAPLEKMGWSLGVMIPKQELLADVHSLNRDIFLIAGTGLVMMLLIIILISRSITKPIRQLSASTQEISQGNLDARLPDIKSGDEVGQLYSSFDNMRYALKEYIANLTETTKAKERIESELHIAHTIQMSFLPKRFPPFPDRPEFELYATLVPAKEIGGDLYDYFFLDQENLFISIGDVSDKGVPAALFMAATKTLVKGIAENMDEPSKIMEKVNFELCQENESCMFVTYFSGILNIRSGTLRYSSAGHNPPLLVIKDSRPQWLDVPPGLVLGAMEESRYTDLEIHLQSGDTLLLYTDGVTEAINDRQEVYSDQGLLEKTNELQNNNPEHIVSGIMESIRGFSRGVDQSDDITLLVLTYKGA